MSPSTVAYPALLGYGGRFIREVARMDAQVRCAGLFDQPLDRDGLHGHTHPEREAIRAFDLLGEAFGLAPDALEEWHWLCAFGEVPPLGSALVRLHGLVLPDLLLRVQTLALYKDRDGHGAVHIKAWRRVRPLRDLLGTRARLDAEVRAYAPHLAAYVETLQDEFAANPMGGLRDLRRAWLVAGLTAAGWRWLLRNRPADPATARDSLAVLGWSTTLANLLGELGPAFAPDDLFSRYVGRFEEVEREEGRTLDGRGWLVEAAWRQFQGLGTQDDKDYFMLFMFRRVAGWVLKVDWMPDGNQRRVGWRSIERAWRADTGHTRGPVVRWPVPGECVRQGGLVARPIANSWELFGEGHAMGHCIGDYVDQCATGRFLAFSVSGPDGRRVATISFEHAPDGRRWERCECRGRFNRDINDQRVYSLMAAVHEALEAMDAGSSPA